MESASSTIPLEEIAQTVMGVLQGGTTGNIVKGVLLILIVAIFFGFRRWMKKQEIKASRRRTEQRRQDNQTTVSQDADQVSSDANQSEGRIDDILED